MSMLLTIKVISLLKILIGTLIGSLPTYTEETRSTEAMATQLARWTKAGRWENWVIVQVSPDSDSWGSRVTLFMPGESSSINNQLRKRAQLDNYQEDKERSSILHQSNVRSGVINKYRQVCKWKYMFKSVVADRVKKLWLA
jgi:hypothetical protein